MPFFLEPAFQLHVYCNNPYPRSA
jgi:hypothetical protein